MEASNEVKLFWLKQQVYLKIKATIKLSDLKISDNNKVLFNN